MSSHTHTHAPDTGDLQTEGNVLRWAGSYDLVVNLLSLGHESRLRQATVARAGVQPGDQVLDVGCGTGSLTLAAAKRAGASGRVYGLDAAPEMIAVAARKTVPPGAAPVTFRAGLIERLEFPDASFDVVLSSLMMHHLTDDLRRRGLAEIRRVLKPGGRVFIVDFTGGGGPGGLHGLIMGLLGHLSGGQHGAPTTPSQDLPAQLAAAGFVAISSGPLGLPGMGFAGGQTPPASQKV